MIPAIVTIAVLLYLAVGLRDRLVGLARLRIPASLVAGILGLGLFQLTLRAQFIPTSITTLADNLSNQLRGWPGPLIAVVFAGMLLSKNSPRRTFSALNLKRVARQGLMVWIIVLGQTMVGLWATWWLIQPIEPLPNSVAMLIETGFAGGHGTAAVMGTVFNHSSIKFAAGLDLGLLMATAGLAFGLLSGMVWVNVAVRLGWVEPADMIETDGSSPASSSRPLTRPLSLGQARIAGDNVDPLLLQAIWLALALGVGVLLQGAVDSFATWIDGPTVETSAESIDGDVAGDEQLRKKLTAGGLLGSLPLFIYTLFGGVIVRALIDSTNQKHRIDHDTIQRLTSSAMDVLVVAAVATLDLRAVATLWYPFLILFIAGTLWCCFCLLVLSRWILPRSIWFHLGIINYGMSTGTTATGFVLLRTIDPELKTGAAEDYALAAPLSAPFIGGGILTVALPLLVLERVPIAFVAGCITLLVIALIAAGIVTKRRAVD